jgi:integrase
MVREGRLSLAAEVDEVLVFRERQNGDASGTPIPCRMHRHDPDDAAVERPGAAARRSDPTTRAMPSRVSGRTRSVVLGVSEFLGHSTAGITERIYTHAFNGDAREQRVREAMAAAMSGGNA